MTTPRTRPLLALIVATTIAVSGCQSVPASSPNSKPTIASTCPELAVQIVDAVQDYVDSFAEVSASEVGGAVSARQTDFEDAAAKLSSRGRELGCEPNELANLIRGELNRLTGGTPVQDAVADTFRADPLGSVDPSDPGPTEVQVASAEQLYAAVSSVGSGSTIRLASGTYALSVPLVLLRPITIIGAGDGRDPDQASSIVSTAPGASLIAATSGDFALTDLAIKHSGKQAASVIVVAGGGYRIERVQVSGAVAVSDAGGYGIVLRPSSNPLTPTGSARVLTDVTLDANAEGGVVIAGTEKPRISRVEVAGSSGCGFCWVEEGGGTASQVSVKGGQIGIRIDQAAAPEISQANVSDAQVGASLTTSGSTLIEKSVFSGALAGVQVTGSGTATLVGNRVLDATEVGIRLSEKSRTDLEDNLVDGATTIGIATVGQAASTITGGQVSSTGDVGLIWAEDATGQVTNVVIGRAKLGVQLASSAAVDLTDVVADRSVVGALLASGNSSGTITRLVCGSGDSAIVVLTDASAVRMVDSPTCQKHRQ